MRNLTLFIVFMLMSFGANAQTKWFYNYSNVPVAPVVQPQVNYQALHSYINNYNSGYNAPVQQYRSGGYTVIQSGGQMAICSTFNNVTTCY